MFVATLAVGIAAVVAIGAAPLYLGRLPLRREPGLGSALVLGAVGLACLATGAHDRLVASAVLALGAFPLLLAGALLLLAPEGGDGRGGGADGDPPWWPEFEAELRRYSRHAPVTGRS